MVSLWDPREYISPSYKDSSLAWCETDAHVTSSSPFAMTTHKLPTFDELPPFKEFSGCAWEVWGKDDQLGTVNLLTSEVVKEASKEIKCDSCQIACILLITNFGVSYRTGKSICLNW